MQRRALRTNGARFGTAVSLCARAARARLMDARFLQLCDSAFPSGAFSQSFGLETAITERGLNDAVAVAAWITEYLERSLATLDARAFVLGMRGTATPAELDEL